MACGRRAALFLMMFLSFVGKAAAELGVELGIEDFRWREFSETGERLLEESGPRYRLGVHWLRPLGAHGLDSLHLRGALYFGDVAYDGQSQNLFTGATAPFQTDVDYSGLVLEAMLARRLNPLSHAEILLGGGVDTWRRDIMGRDGVRGVIEDWTVFYLLAGGGGRWTHAAKRFNLQAGVKFPFYTYEAADFDLELEPKGQLSLFARFTATLIGRGRPQGVVGIYYDSYRFDRSDPESAFVPGAGVLSFVQPESHQHVVGVYGVLYLR